MCKFRYSRIKENELKKGSEMIKTTSKVCFIKAGVITAGWFLFWFFLGSDPAPSSQLSDLSLFVRLVGFGTIWSSDRLVEDGSG